MTRSEILALSGRGLAEAAATLVMGWGRHFRGGMWRSADGKWLADDCDFLPDQSSDADYEVLKHVTSNWSKQGGAEFLSAAFCIRRERNSEMYIPGDYARAALMAKENTKC